LPAPALLAKRAAAVFSAEPVAAWSALDDARNLKDASDDQKQQYQAAFQAYMVRYYWSQFSSFNAALQKSFHIIPGHENHQLIFKAEGFNYLNHPNWDNPDVSPTSSTFGKVTNKGNTYASERQLQFSLRYAF